MPRKNYNPNQIRLLILDVDGVIVGEKIGYNSPHPHPDVLLRLKNIKKNGVHISLCTAKPHYAIKDIINTSHLTNPHITDGGAVLIDSINQQIVKKHVIGKDIATKILKRFIEEGIYTEFYTPDNYYLQTSQQNDTTTIHTHILQQPPIFADSLSQTSHQLEVVKIMPIAPNKAGKEKINQVFSKYTDYLTLSWGIHPIALPRQFGIITTKHISKKEAAQEIAHSLNIIPSHMLGIGDSTSDWQFIENCAFAGAMGNASAELKALIKTKERDRYCIGKSVDDNGVLHIFDYFQL
ncbi:hypothetical protein A2W24_01470 [Microgenomates group bacterium RBG_16_45_19]|nr:MAG: hypothetical protein A2W24_01470 [Microgenomates group bacterium RBG_16_45_19]